MNFQSMDYFTMVAHKRSFTKAAEALHITQQTLSVHIATIEQEIGCQLFIRHVPLELTYAGEIFLQYALDFQKKYSAMWHEFGDISQNQKGKLRIGVAHTRGRAILPALIENFQRSSPQIEIHAVEKTNDNLQKSLLDGDIDLAIGNFDKKIPGIALRNFYEEEVVLLVSRKLLAELFDDENKICNLIASNEDILALAQCPFVLNSQQNIGGRIGREIISKSSFKPVIKAQSENIETLLDLCARGVGACFCPENLICTTLSEKQISSLHVLRFKNSGTRYMIRFGWAEQAYQWTIIDDFMQKALENLNNSK
ncbi:MAG: LysR family transcriptional regulator [Candidatus Fimivivens sp.]|nr:LysR family transcriptional regulator [Candidatus Fimivivens sp.]